MQLDVSGPREQTRAGTGLKPYLWALGLTWALPAVLVLVGWIVLSVTQEASACEHPTMSCVSIEPAPMLLMLAAMFLLPACLAAGLLAVTVIAVVGAARRRAA